MTTTKPHTSIFLITAGLLAGLCAGFASVTCPDHGMQTPEMDAELTVAPTDNTSGRSLLAPVTPVTDSPRKRSLALPDLKLGVLLYFQYQTLKLPLAVCEVPFHPPPDKRDFWTSGLLKIELKT